MSLDLARTVADAVLWEGYLLYPYRASAPKNQFRWQFGVLAPHGADTGDPWRHQTECLVDPRGPVSVDITVRFLQVRRRTGPVPWDEAVAREFTATVTPTADQTSWELPFSFPGGTGNGSSGGEDAESAWRSWPVSGRLLVDAETVDHRDGLLKLRIRVQNSLTWQDPGAPRADVLRQALIACHTLAEVHNGEFLSLREPPEWARIHAVACDNQHTWPVLIEPQVTLSSPIILDDYPRIAPESPQPLHDSTEIDELLLLRTAALTDDEKAEARATDPRAAAIVDAADTLSEEALSRLHGVVREIRPVGSPKAGAAPVPVGTGTLVADDAEAEVRAGACLRSGGVPWWDPGVDASVSPETDQIEVSGGYAARGSQVRLRPGTRRSDAQDMFLWGRTATVRAVLFDVEDCGYLAVTVDGDPAADLHDSLGRFRYFTPDEVELLTEPGGGDGSRATGGEG
ncbi:MAG: hypothetical protein ACRDUA_06120 [Micromonosporaceae bacterium]